MIIISRNQFNKTKLSIVHVHNSLNHILIAIQHMGGYGTVIVIPLPIYETMGEQGGRGKGEWEFLLQASSNIF